MEKCLMCNGDMVEQPAAYMVEIDSCILVVKNVPTLVCQQCGEKAYTDDVAAVLESIVTKAREMLTEVAVVNYPHSAA